MKLKDEMPTEGQFVAVWHGVDGKLYCDLHRVVDGKPTIFDGDEWKACNVEQFYKIKQAKFIVES